MPSRHQYAQRILELLQSQGYTAALTRSPQDALYIDAISTQEPDERPAPQGCPPRFRIGEPDLSLAGAEEQLRDSVMLIDPAQPLDLRAVADYVERCRGTLPAAPADSAALLAV